MNRSDRSDGIVRTGYAARFRFSFRCNSVRDSRIPEMVDVSKHWLKRLDDILRRFDHSVSNAVAEGMNNVYKKIESVAYVLGRVNLSSAYACFGRVV